MTGADRTLLVYVAGPYRPTPAQEQDASRRSYDSASTARKRREHVLANRERARKLGLAVVAGGDLAVVPHLLSHPDDPETQSDEWWLASTLQLMLSCDAVCLVDGWEQSTGTRAEVTEALRCGWMPIWVGPPRDDSDDVEAVRRTLAGEP
jgi:hypothetical protein